MVNFMKIRPVRAAGETYRRTGGQTTDITKLNIIGFHNFANAPNKAYKENEFCLHNYSTMLEAEEVYRRTRYVPRSALQLHRFTSLFSIEINQLKMAAYSQNLCWAAQKCFLNHWLLQNLYHSTTSSCCHLAWGKQHTTICVTSQLKSKLFVSLP
jgi:hypothetical protein